MPSRPGGLNENLSIHSWRHRIDGRSGQHERLSSRWAVGNGSSRDGLATNGSSRDGLSANGRSRDGLSTNGSSRDGLATNGRSTDGLLIGKI